MDTPAKDIQDIADKLSAYRLDPEAFKGQVVDEELVEWYKKRFEMFAEDRCRGAIGAYLKKLQFENCNELTKVVIMYHSLNV